MRCPSDHVDRDHQHWRRSIGGQRAAYGDVDEEHAQREVLERSGMAGRNTVRASISAAIVIAAGSVISDPSSGTARGRARLRRSVC